MRMADKLYSLTLITFMRLAWDSPILYRAKNLLEGRLRRKLEGRASDVRQSLTLIAW